MFVLFKDTRDFCHVEVFLRKNIKIVESVVYNFISKELKVRLNVMEVLEAKLLWVTISVFYLFSGFVYFRESDGRVVKVAENEALTFVRGEGWKRPRHGFLLAEHI